MVQYVYLDFFAPRRKSTEPRHIEYRPDMKVRFCKYNFDWLMAAPDGEGGCRDGESGGQDQGGDDGGAAPPPPVEPLLAAMNARERVLAAVVENLDNRSYDAELLGLPDDEQEYLLWNEVALQARRKLLEATHLSKRLRGLRRRDR